VTTGYTSAVTGKANTAGLQAGWGVGSVPYPAGYYDSYEYGTPAVTACVSQNAYGHTDWYLPAQNELNVLYTNEVAIGSFNLTGSAPAGYYWSSSEVNNNVAWYQRFSDGNQNNDNKNNANSVRCVRR
jgi:hypothetical protein